LITAKKIRNYILLILLAVLIGQILYMSRNPDGREVLAYFFSSSTPNWKTYTPGSEFYLDSPFPIDWESKPNENLKILGHCRLNKADFFLNVFFSHTTNPQTSCNFAENHLRLTKSFIEKQKNFTWKDQPITCSGIPATVYDYSYQNGGFIERDKDLVMIYDNRTLAILSYSSTDKAETYNNWMNRIFDSVKITPSNS